MCCITEFPAHVVPVVILPRVKEVIEADHFQISHSLRETTFAGSPQKLGIPATQVISRRSRTASCRANS